MERLALIALLFLVFLVKMGGTSILDTKGKSVMYGREYYLLATNNPSSISSQGVTYEYNKPNKTFYIRTTPSSSSSNRSKKGLLAALGTPVKFIRIYANTSKGGPDYDEDMYIQMGEQGLYWGLRGEGEEYMVVLTRVPHRAKFQIVPSNICPANDIIEQCPYTSLKTCSPTNTFCVRLDFHTLKGVKYFKIYDHTTPGDAPGGIRIDLHPV